MRRLLFRFALPGLAFLALALAGYQRYLDRSELSVFPELEFETDPEITAGHTPQVCNSQIDASGSFGNGPEECLPNHTFVNAEDISDSGWSGTAAGVQFSGICCALPSDDILTKEHVYNVETECPSNYVITGSVPGSCGERCFVRCTRINTDRYKLGPKYQGAYWKLDGIYPSGGRSGAPQILHSDIPAGLRYGVGFKGLNSDGTELWDSDGCVAVPFGALPVEKRHPGCGGLYYRPLLYRNGKAVRMFPDCVAVEAAASKEPRCIQGSAK